MNGLVLSLFLACGPFFPISYFPQEHGDCDYSLHDHFGTELAMIGAHYYPDWTGKAPVGNAVSTAKADELDFFAAGKAAGVAQTEIEREWTRFDDFKNGVCKRLEDGEKVEVPKGIAAFAEEFYLYKLGHAQWLVFRKDEDPASFGKLLSLPRERRLHRTVWVHFVRIANATKAAEKDRHLAALRRALDEGYRDTAGLEEHVLRFLNRTCGVRYAPLILAAYQGAPSDRWPKFALEIFQRGRWGINLKDGDLVRLCGDAVGVEVAVACGLGAALPESAVKPGHPVLEADRQAWIAFDRGETDLAKRLLKLAPEDSLIRLFLESRFARLDGDYKTAGEKLSRWLDIYKRKGSSVVGYAVGISDSYWDCGMLPGSGRQGYWDSPYYTGGFGPAGQFNGWFNCQYCSSEDDEGIESDEASRPTLARVVAGELGLVKVATRDLEEALHAFLRARNWIDIAFVAERCLTVDELLKVMTGRGISPRDKELLSGLLTRRMMRTGRVQEALAWAPADIKPLVKEYAELWRCANDAKADADAQAIAFFNLSRLVGTRGMELMGSELRPDVAIFGGSLAMDGMSIGEPGELLQILHRDDRVWQKWTPPEDRVDKRFHYRYKSVEFARRAALLAKDADVKAWSLMMGGVMAVSVDDPKLADWFYKRLKRMDHPQAKVGAWFDGTYRAFREKYYNGERHVKPLRVPPRFTREMFKSLDLH